ncbi:type IV fimbrial assembly protein PilC [Gracilibacillus boraciitolerans JCM 21714]|uniref:Type IV fimbrial assembly protein PilC n=1 Tax=Gracilibacillus boraciitolerans JCM 21714 TaxID=1298598 RepID=W4VHJ1_9BACI|nr:type II secretion system F family protein [Gracilibacillus boraciitolerans]GAE92626.1 type IV fimbrial assembly protein PilC [Gracilibacillus boraciitolerans JCM 21714]
MAFYSYKARSANGKLKNGKLESDNEAEALIELTSLDLHVFQIKKVNSFLYRDIYIGSPVKHKDFIIFLRQFSTLVDAGLSLVDTIEILAEQSNSKVLKEALDESQEMILEGKPLSEAFASFPKLFPALLISMIKAGEVSGRLDDILDRMATYYEKQYQLKQKVITALTYPAVIGILSLSITIFLFAYIVPIFADMFLSFGQELPFYTKMVLDISSFFQQFWWVIVIGLALVVLLFRVISKNETLAYRLDILKLKIPVIGTFIQKATLSRMTQTLSSLINSSVSILQAVEITKDVIENRVVKEVLADSKKALENGQSLAKPMNDHWVFPKLITQMIAVGEATGSIDQMLQKVSDYYEQDLEEASDKLKSLIEPIMIVFLSVIVGSIVLAIVIPMFTLFETI